MPLVGLAVLFDKQPSEMSLQDTIFQEREADRWFDRNRADLAKPEIMNSDPVLRLIHLVGLLPKRVIEIGAADGFRLHSLQEIFQCEAVGVEPSQTALEEGRAAYPKIRLLKGMASALPVKEDASFDLVIISCVLHWIDRSTLLRSCAEADRMLADGGFLIICDFFPIHPERVNYHHCEDGEVFTYKQNYGEIFLATQLYTQYASLALRYEGWACAGDVPASDRYQICALKKTGFEKFVRKEFRASANEH